MSAALRDPSTPHELLNYRLMRLFALGSAPVVRLCEGRYGVSRREWRLLALLTDLGPMSPTELSERAALDLARTSRVISALIRKQLVRRDARLDDHRRAVVAATPAGARLHAEIFPQIAAFNTRLVSVLDPVQLDHLDKLLDALTQHAEALASPGDASPVGEAADADLA